LVEPVFFDTSVLLPALVALGPDDSPAMRLFDVVASGELRRPRTAWHCVLEFLSVSTRLPVPVRLTPENALFLVREEILPRFDVEQLPPVDFGRFLQTAGAERIAGGRIYDLHIAEVARACGSQIVVTDNRRHFVSLLRFGIRVVTAAELLDELP